MTFSTSELNNQQQHNDSDERIKRLLEQRRALYGLYESNEDMLKAFETNGVDIPTMMAHPQGENKIAGDEDDNEIEKSSSKSNNGENNSDSFVPDRTASTTLSSSTLLPTPATSNSSGGGRRDIWGRFPPKEPKEMIPCPVCNRSLNTLRFAPHLDKCMGFGNTSRAAASSTRNSAVTIGSSSSLKSSGV